MDDRHTVLVPSGGAYGHHAGLRAGAGLADHQNLALGVERVAFEHRRRQPDLLPAQVGDHVPRQIRHRLSGGKRQRETRVHQRPSEWSPGAVVVIDVDRILVLRQKRKPGVVGGKHGASERVENALADPEVLEEASGVAFPRGRAGHEGP